MRVLRDIQMILTLSCDESSRLLSDDLERRLTLPERTALRFHLLLCGPCRRFRRNIRLLRELVRGTVREPTADDTHPPSLVPEARQRILASLRKAQSGES